MDAEVLIFEHCRRNRCLLNVVIDLLDDSFTVVCLLHDSVLRLHMHGRIMHIRGRRRNRPLSPSQPS